MAAVNLLNYVEVDPQGNLTITASALDVLNAIDDTEAYVVRDYGDGFVVDSQSFLDTFVFRLRSTPAGDHIIHHYSSSPSGYATNVNGIGCTYFGVSPFEGLYVHEYRQGMSTQTSQATDTEDITLDTDYYCQFEYDAATYPVAFVRLRVYSDQAMQNQVGNTAQVEITNGFSHRYHYAYTSNNYDASQNQASFVVRDYDLGLFTGETPGGGLALKRPALPTALMFHGGF